ncbi:MAG: glycoside hydrolase family 15 protein [Pseudomonas sp.]
MELSDGARYRYVWVRDAAYTTKALLSVGARCSKQPPFAG